MSNEGEVRSKASEKERKEIAKDPLPSPAELVQRADANVKADKAPEKPVTEASGIFGDDRGGTPAEKEANREIADNHPKKKVRLLQGYQAREGAPKLKRGAVLDLPVEDARYLVESRIAELYDPEVMDN